MAGDQLHQVNHFPGDAFPPTLPHPHNRAQQNARVLPGAVNNGQPEGHWEDIPQLVGDVVRLDGLQGHDHHNPNAAHHGMADYQRPEPGVVAVPYVFDGVGLAQGVLLQEQANIPDHLNRDNFGYAPQHIAQGPAQAAFSPFFARRIPIGAPNQPRENNLRRLASRYLHRPDSQVNMVWMEPGMDSRLRVVIILEASDVL